MKITYIQIDRELEEVLAAMGEETLKLEFEGPIVRCSSNKPTRRGLSDWAPNSFALHGPLIFTHLSFYKQLLSK